MFSETEKEVRMQNFQDNRTVKDVTASANESSLASFFQKTYAYMGISLLLTFGIAYIMAYPLHSQLVGLRSNMLTWIILFGAQIALIFLINRNALKNTSKAVGGLVAFAVIEGIFFGTILSMFSAQAVVSAFLVATVDFGGMALYGFFTKRNLSNFAPILFGGLIALIIGSIVSIFLHSTGLYFIITIVGVLIFSGYAAFDHHNLKRMYFALQSQGMNTTNGLAISGALMLYLDFINLFIYFLQLFSFANRS